MLPTCPSHLAHPTPTPTGEPACVQGSGRGDVLLQTAAHATQDAGLFAFRPQGDTEEAHRDSEESMLQKHSLCAGKRLSDCL